MSAPALKQNFISEFKNGVYFVRLASGRQEALEFLAFELTPQIEKVPGHVAIDMSDIEELTAENVTSLIGFADVLNKRNLQLRLTRTSTGFKNYLTLKNLNSILLIAETEGEAIVQFRGASKRKSNAGLVTPFLEATIRVLEVQASTKSKALKPYRRDSSGVLLGDLNGAIDLKSEDFNGAVMISFPAPTFLKLISRMLGEEFSELTTELHDGAGELTNIIFGQAKVNLNERGFKFQTALPTVILGSSRILGPEQAGPSIVIPLTSDAGPLYVELCFSK